MADQCLSGLSATEADTKFPQILPVIRAAVSGWNPEQDEHTELFVALGYGLEIIIHCKVFTER